MVAPLEYLHSGGIESSSKLRTYALVKKYFCVEPYHSKNQRICTRCELNEIDEIHLLLHCSAMNNIREILFHSVAAIIDIQQTNEIFLQIMTSRDITVVKSIAQFIYGCFKQIKG